MDDPYIILGVTKQSTDAEVRSAFLRLAKQCHPDLHKGDKKAEEQFKRISGANDILSNPELRLQYDLGHIDGSGQAKQRPAGGFAYAARPTSRPAPPPRPANPPANASAAGAYFDPAFGAVLFGLFNQPAR